MQYVLLAYPSISKSDYERIQNIRKAHDGQFSMVKPHFTIVFPTAKLSELELLKHVESLNLKTKEFSFVLTKAIVEENISSKYYQVHLVASEPIVEIIRLHDILYVDALSSELREDIPYLPHITIASNKDKTTMQTLADNLNASNLHINGTISEITAGAFDGVQVIAVKSFQLALL